MEERDEPAGPVIAGRKITAEDVLRRLMLVARSLGFVVLVFFVPDVLRGIARDVVGGGGFHGLITGESEAPLLALLVTAAAVAISVAVVTLHGRLGDGAAEPRRLLRLDRRWTLDWGKGFLAGAAAATLAIVPLLATGAMHVRGLAARDASPVLGLALLVALLLRGLHEEMGFRGPAFRDLGRAISPPLAAAFLAGSFALIHGGNPAFDRMGLLGVFIAGFAFAGFVRARGDLGMATGAHTGWNVFVGLVWSVPVSGYRLPGRLLDVEPSSASEAARWSGGDFGVEGGLAGIVALFLLGLFAWRMRGPEDRSGA